MRLLVVAVLALSLATAARSPASGAPTTSVPPPGPTEVPVEATGDDVPTAVALVAGVALVVAVTTLVTVRGTLRSSRR